MNHKVMEWARQAVASWMVVCVFWVSTGLCSVAQADALAWDSRTKAWFGDVNGDGVTDVLLQPLTDNPSLTFGSATSDNALDTAHRVSLPQLLASNASATHAYDWSQQEAVLQLLDVNGDTLADILVWHPDAQRAWVFLGQVSSPMTADAPMTDFQTFDFTTPHQTLTPADLDDIHFSFDVRLTVIDANHDGLDDVFIQRIDGFSHHLLHSVVESANPTNTTRLLTLAQTLPYHTPWAKQRTERFVVSDYNGDGIDDIMAVARSEGNPHYLVLTDAKGHLDIAGEQLPHYLSQASWAADSVSIIPARVNDTAGDELVRLADLPGGVDERGVWHDTDDVSVADTLPARERLASVRTTDEVPLPLSSSVAASSAVVPVTSTIPSDVSGLPPETRARLSRRPLAEQQAQTEAVLTQVSQRYVPDSVLLATSERTGVTATSTPHVAHHTHATRRTQSSEHCVDTAYDPVTGDVTTICGHEVINGEWEFSPETPVSLEGGYHAINSEVTFKWPSVQGAKLYKVFWSPGTLANEPSQYHALPSVTSSSITVPVSEVGYYYVKYKACYTESLCSQLSPWRRIFVYTTPQLAKNTQVSPAVVAHGETIRFQWYEGYYTVDGSVHTIERTIDGGPKETVFRFTRSTWSERAFDEQIAAVGAGSHRYILTTCTPALANRGVPMCGPPSVFAIDVFHPLPETFPHDISITGGDTHPKERVVYFTWPAVADADSYRIEMGLGSLASGEAFNYDVVATPHGTEYSRRFSAPGIYYARILACNVGGCTQMSNPTRFRVYDAPGAPVNVSLPRLAATDTPVTLSFTQGSDGVNGTSHVVKLTQNNGPEGTVYEATRHHDSQLTFSVPRTHAVPGEYTYRVYSCSPGVGCGPSVTKHLTIYPPLPSDYTGNISFVQGDTVKVNTLVTVQWAGVFGADTIRLYAAQGINPPMSQFTAVWEGSGSSFSYTPSHNGWDHFYVVACNAGGCTPPPSQPTASVLVYTAPGKVNALTAPSSVNVNSPATINWHAAGGSVIGAHYEVWHTAPNQGEVFVEQVSQTQMGQVFSYPVSVTTPGLHTFRLVACNPNGAGCGGSGSVSITAENQAPIANIDSVTTDEDTAMHIPVLANDSDTTGSINQFSLHTQPSHGVASIDNATSTVLYTPSANFCGTDSFTYTATDNYSATSAPATVNITVTCVNDAPTITGPTFAQYYAREIIASDFSVSDVDNPLTELTVSVESDYPYLYTAFAASITPGVHSLIQQSQGYWSGNTSVTVSVSDGDQSSSWTFGVEVLPPLNVAPVISGASTVELWEDTTAQVPLTISDSWTPTDALTVSFYSDKPELISASALSWVGTGNTRQLTLTPKVNANTQQSDGSHAPVTLTVTANDGGLSASHSIVVTIKAVEDAPILAPIAPQTVSYGETLIIPLALTDVDSEIREFNITATSQEVSVLLQSDISTHWNWRTNQHEVHITPSRAIAGTVPVYISALNGNSVNQTINVTVAVPQVAPTISGTPAPTADVGTLYTFTPTLNDQNGDSLTLTATGLPSWLTIDPATHTLSGIPTLDDIGQTSPITLTVSDGQGAHSKASLAPFTLSVEFGENTVVDFSSEIPSATGTLSFPIKDTGDVVGTIGAQMRVSETGALTYNVPFDLPAGIAGVKPELAISYNSQNSQSSLLGVGWSIGGISAIARCAKTQYTDKLSDVGGYTKALALDSTDALCLDGQRLIEVAEDSYRTTSDSFSTIQAHYTGGDGSQPSGFTISTKSGETHYYGLAYRATDKHALVDVNDVTLRWQRTRIEDVYGTGINFVYSQANEQFYLDEINYGPNEASGSAANVVSFTYEDKPGTDAVYGYWYGLPLRQEKRLQRIRATINDQEFRTYTFTYEGDVNTASYLNQVDACVGDACLKPINFTWQHAANTYATTASMNALPVKTERWKANTQIVDINGDGQSDVIMPYDTGSHHKLVAFLSGNAGLARYSSALYLGDEDDERWSLAQLRPLSIDGQTQVIAMPVLVSGEGLEKSQRRYQWKAWRFRPDGYLPKDCLSGSDETCQTPSVSGGLTVSDLPLPTMGQSSVESLAFTDSDGDGRTDVMRVENGNIVTYRSNGTTLLPAETLVDLNELTITDEQKSHIRATIQLNACQAGLYPEACSQYSDSAVSFGWQPAGSGLGSSFFDISGDGRADMLGYLVGYFSAGIDSCRAIETAPTSYDTETECSGKTVTFKGRVPYNGITTGATFTWDTTITAASYNTLQMGDINGDGLGDLFGYYHTPETLHQSETSSWTVSYWTGEKLTPATYLPLLSKKILGEDVVFTDINLDGRLDVLLRDEDSVASCEYWQVYQFDTSTNSPTLNNQGYGMCLGNDADKPLVKQGDFDGDGLSDWMQYNEATEKFEFYSLTDAHSTPKTITHFEDSLGNTTTFDYAPLTDSDVYVPTTGAAYPVIEQRAGQIVVKAVHSDDGLEQGGKQSIYYRYQGARQHRWGRGSLGFSAIETRDSRHDTHDMITTTHYHQGLDSNLQFTQPELVALPTKTLSERVKRTDGTRVTLGESLNTYQVNTTASSINDEDQFSPYHVYASQVVDVRADLQTTFEDTAGEQSALVTLPTKTSTSRYDALGNLEANTVTTTHEGDSYQVTSLHWYGESHTDGTPTPSACTSAASSTFDAQSMQRFGRLTCSQVTTTHTVAGTVTSDTNYAAFGYDNNGILVQEVTNVGTSRQISTIYTLDSVGNRLQTTLTAPDFDSASNTYQGQVVRHSYATFDANQQFMVSTTNDLGHKSCSTFDALGRVTKTSTNTTNCATTDDKFTTHYQVNAFGEVIATRSPTGVITGVRHHWCNDTTKATCTIATADASVPQYSYYKENVEDAAPDTRVYFDIMGREIVQATQGADGQWRYKLSTFTADNKASVAYAPTNNLANFLNEASNKSANVSYDIVGRIVEVVSPVTDGALKQTRTAYQGFTTEVSSIGKGADGTTQTITHKTQKNALGQVIAVTDNAGNTLHRTYDIRGHLKTTTDSAGNVTTLFYNEEGERIKMQDPDKGEWTYAYNGLGELIKQTDANGQVIENRYDTLGRLVQTISHANHPNDTVSTCHNFDGNFFGSADDSVKRYGTRCTSGTIIEQSHQDYDDYGRPTLSTRGVTTPSNGTETFISRVYYDALSRPVIQQLDNQVATLTEFNAYGYATKSSVLTTSVQNDTVTLNKASLREAKTYDGWGKVTQVTLLDSITQDITYDAFSGIQVGLQSGITNGEYGEIKYTFGVDAFGNISSRTVSGMEADLQEEQFDYDKLFRLTKYRISNDSAVTTDRYYCYDALGNLLNKGASSNTCSADYTYGNAARSQGNAGVHAVSTITSKGLRFRYDNNGNMVEETKDAQVNRQITYNADDQATRIIRTGVQQIDFSYGLNGRVWRQDTRLGAVPEQADADNQNRLTFYHGALEKVITDGDQPSTLKRISLGSIVLTYHANTKVWQTDVLVKDNQGSTMAVANADGDAQHRYRYDPFGEQRTISTGYLAAMVTKGYLPTTQRGYTGHEMLNNVNIIHMNGRIYDPTIGRFLQADPHIQAPDNLQNYNRYSYVLNNPMSYTDPSGYFFKWIADVWENTVGDVLRAIADIPILDTLVKFGLNLVCPGICTIAYSVASAYAVTGSLTAAVTAGFVAHVFSEIGERFRGLSDTNQQAIVNGLAKEVDFVEFGGNTLKTSQMLEQISAHALTGGISAVASGGRFGSAFVSAGLTKGIMGQLSYDDTSPQAVAGRTVLASVIGGTASVLTGGKFANGASTAAIAHLLNAEGGSWFGNEDEGGNEKNNDSKPKYRWAFRALTPEQRKQYDLGLGIYARKRNGTITPEEHVGKGAAVAALSPWISTSTQLNLVKDGYLCHESGIVIIDLTLVDSQMVTFDTIGDVWLELPLYQKLAYHRAVWAQEILVKEYIPQKALTLWDGK